MAVRSLGRLRHGRPSHRNLPLGHGQLRHPGNSNLRVPSRGFPTPPPPAVGDFHTDHRLQLLHSGGRVLPVTLLSGDAVLLAFVGVFAGCVMFTQQFHAWAHTPKGKLPPLLAALQDAGIMLPRAHHAAHHRPPFDGTYCTVSGVWNGVLDRWRVFTAVEVVIFRLFGCRPRSWAEPDAEWTQKTQLDDGMD